MGVILFWNYWSQKLTRIPPTPHVHVHSIMTVQHHIQWHFPGDSTSHRFLLILQWVLGSQCSFWFVSQFNISFVIVNLFIILFTVLLLSIFSDIMLQCILLIALKEGLCTVYKIVYYSLTYFVVLVKASEYKWAVYADFHAMVGFRVLLKNQERFWRQSVYKCLPRC